MISTVFVALLTLVTLTAMTFAFYLKFRRRYTRERYAFAALAATVSITALTITNLTIVPPWIGVAQVAGSLLGHPMAPLPTPHWSEKVLIIVFAMFSIWLIHKAFVNWNGPISVSHHKMERLHESTNLIFEGALELRRLIARMPPSEVYQRVTDTQRPSILQTPEDSCSWRDHARELVELKWQSYFFDPEHDWHARQNCWIGRDIKAANPVAVLCAHEPPSAEQVGEFLNYVLRVTHARDSDVEFICAIQTNGSYGVQQHFGHPVIFETEESLLDDLVDFTDYVVDVRKRVVTTNLPDSELKLDNIYAESYITSSPDKAGGRGLEDYLLEWLREPGGRQLALLGEYGQGKSTGALMFTYKTLTGHFGDVARIPILIELRGKSPATLQPIELLGAWASHYRIDPRALMKLHQAGRLCVVFEGFDEMSGVADLEARLAHFRTLWRFCYPQAKILITGRPNFFLDDHELKAALGISQAAGAGPYCEAIHLVPFSTSQIHESLRWADCSVRDEIVAFSEENATFRDIVSRPSLLYIVARLWGSPELANRRESMTSALVMGTFVHHCYRRQTEKHRNSPEFMVLTEAERKFFTDGLAAFMVAAGASNQITRYQLEDGVSALFGAIPESISGSAPLSNEPTRPLRERLAGREDALEAVMTDVRSYGLLTRDFSRPDALKFPHKSFFEFLFGNYVAKCLTGAELEACRAIQAATNVKVEAITDMPEAVAFAGEVIADSLERTDNRAKTVDAFLDMIVIPKRLRRLRFVKYLILWEATTRFMPFPYRILSPALIGIALLPIGSFLVGRILHIREVSGEIGFLVFMTTASILFMLSISGFVRRRRLVCLWYYIVRNLGFTEQELALAYGQRIVTALCRMTERTAVPERRRTETPGFSR